MEIIILFHVKFFCLPQTDSQFCYFTKGSPFFRSSVNSGGYSKKKAAKIEYFSLKKRREKKHELLRQQNLVMM